MNRFRHTTSSHPLTIDVKTMPGSHFWKEMAYRMAKDAYENHFPSRRGIWDIDGVLGYFVIYNNNPYAKDSGLRDKETDRIRASMKKLGIEELAYATYPKRGESAGYTYAMIIRADGDSLDKLTDAIQEAIEESCRQLRS